MITEETGDTEHALRRCALTLHAMHPHDRDWMLSRLVPTRRLELQRLVDELEALGIAPDAQLVRQTVNTRQPHAHPDPDSQQRATRIANAPQLASLLATEPALLIASVLNNRDKAFVVAFLACLTPATRDAVAKHMPSKRNPSALPAKLAQALEKEIEARLPAVARTPSRPRPFSQRWHSGWRRVRGLLS